MQSSLQALKHHLGIMASPDYIHIKRCFSAIPQYPVGHEQQKMEFLRKITNEIPHLSVLGIGFYGVSVNDCIAEAKKQSENLLFK